MKFSGLEIREQCPGTHKYSRYILVINDWYWMLAWAVHTIKNTATHLMFISFIIHRTSVIFGYLLTNNGLQLKAKFFETNFIFLGIRSLSIAAFLLQTKSQLKTKNKMVASHLGYFVAAWQGVSDNWVQLLFYSNKKLIHRLIFIAPCARALPSNSLSMKTLESQHIQNWGMCDTKLHITEKQSSTSSLNHASRSPKMPHSSAMSM